MAKTIKPKSKRLKLVVLDANFYWTEQLFSACNAFADVLLLRPWDFRAFREQYGRYFIEFQPQLVTQGIWEQRICCPPGWLFYYWPLTKRFFIRLIQQFQNDNPLVFVFNYPYYYNLVRVLKARSIYYNIDDYRQYWPSRETQTLEVERLAVTHADLTVCVANYRACYLRQRFPSQASQIIHLPHGCSPKFMVEHLLSKPKTLPTELSIHSRPIAGYIGALNYRFDFHYLAQVAEKIPDITILLGGLTPQSHDGSSEWWEGVKAVQHLSNVHFIGPVPHDQLGEYLQSFDVLLMPYSPCNFNLNACPTKLWDYMGTSLPVVANNVVPEVNQWHHLVLISETPEEFAANIRFALANPHWQSQERWEVAQAHTWKMQAQKLYHLMEEREWLA